MKALVVLVMTLASFCIFATEDNSKSLNLSGLAAGELIGVLMDSDSQPYQKSDGNSSWELTNLTCTVSHNGAVDGLFGGIPSYSCHSDYEAFNAISSYAIVDQLKKNGGEFDCSMVRCYIAAKRVSCSILNDDKTPSLKRMACEIVISEK